MNILKDKLRQNREQLTVLLFAAAVSLIFLSFFSKNSFFYPLNNGADINMFYTMGKGIANGLVCYRDIFDQKGPIWYFLYTIAYLLDRNGYWGIFLIEIISFTFFLYFTYKAMKLYGGEKFFYFTAPILAFCTMGNGSFWQGGQAEELIFPLLAYLLYSLLRYFKEDYPEKPMDYKTLLINGICSGLVFWSKFTLIVPWFIFMAGVFIIMISRKHVKRAFISCLVFLAGTLIPTVPVFIYFIANGAVGDLVQVYFIENIFGYSPTVQSDESTLETLWKNVKLGIERIGPSMVLALFGGVGLLFVKKRYLPDWRTKIIFPVMFLVSVLGIYGGGTSYMYYPAALIPYALLGAAVLGDVMNEGWKYIPEKAKPKTIFAVAVAASMIISFAATFDGNRNIHILFEKKEDTVQYRFAETINSVPGSTMINYGFLDHGFYMAADKLPVTKYFARINLKYEALPEMYIAQRDVVKNGEADFVVLKISKDYTLDYIEKIYGSLFDDYIVVDDMIYYNGDSKWESHYILLAHESVDLY